MQFLRDLLNQSMTADSPYAQPTPSTTSYTQTPGSMPADAYNYFQQFESPTYNPYADGAVQKSPYFTDANGYNWISQYEGGGPASDGGDATPGKLTGYRVGTAPGVMPGQRKGTDHYFDTSGKYSYTNKDDPGWLNPLTGVLAVASLGLGGYLAAAGEAGAATGALGSTYGGSTGAGFGQIGLGAGAGSAGAGYGAGLGMGSTFGGSAIGSGLTGAAGAVGGAGLGEIGMGSGVPENAGFTNLGSGTMQPVSTYGSALGQGNTIGSGLATGAASPLTSLGSDAVTNKILQKGGSTLLSSLLQGNGRSGSTGGGGYLNDLFGVGAGAIDYSRQDAAAKQMQDWLMGQQQKMDGFMDPNSPEYQAMWQAMSRKDAAAGRNSQYGPRTADFLSRVAEAKANNTRQFTTGTSRALADALNQRASAPSGLLGALGRGGQSNNNAGLMNLINGLFGGSSNSQFTANDFMPSGGSSLNVSDMNNDDIWNMINGW